MVDRYEVQLNDDTLWFDIWDRVLEDRLFCSFTTKSEAEEVCRKLNARADLFRVSNFHLAQYEGEPRTTKTEKYKFPKLNLARGKKWLQDYINNGKVTLLYE